MEKTLLEQLQEYKLKQIMDPFWEKFEKDLIKRWLKEDVKTRYHNKRFSSKI